VEIIQERWTCTSDSAVNTLRLLRYKEKQNVTTDGEIYHCNSLELEKEKLT
jgi:hypothetical protein